MTNGFDPAAAYKTGPERQPAFRRVEGRLNDYAEQAMKTAIRLEVGVNHLVGNAPPSRDGDPEPETGTYLVERMDRDLDKLEDALQRLDEAVGRLSRELE